MSINGGGSGIAAAKIWSDVVVVVVVVVAAAVAGALSTLIVVERILHVPIAGSIPLIVAGMAIYLFAIVSPGILLVPIAI